MGLVDIALQEERCWFVYVHINKINGKKYVGITSQKVEYRWKNGMGYKGQPFYNAIKKYGWDGFEHEILASNLTEDEANNFEIVLIRELDTLLENGNGYNKTEGGRGAKGRVVTEDTKKKISQANSGKEKTDKYISTMSNLMGGGGNPSAIKVVCNGVVYGSIGECAEAYGVNKDSMRMWLRGTRKMPQKFIELGLDYKNNEEAIIISSRIKNNSTTNSKQIICLNTNEIFDKISDAQNQYNAFNIVKCCKGQNKSSGKHPKTKESLKWMYYEDYIKLNNEREVI